MTRIGSWYLDIHSSLGFGNWIFKLSYFGLLICYMFGETK